MKNPVITKNSNNDIFLKTVTFHRHVWYNQLFY
jgi:hypothetical protein